MRPILCVAALILAGCTAPQGSPSGPPATSMAPSVVVTRAVTPSPTIPSLDASQTAAIAAADAYWVALDKIARSGEFDQYAILKALRPTATDDVIQSNLNGARQLWKAGHHVVGTKQIQSRKASGTQRAGTQVTVTFCQDQDAALANSAGKVVARPYPRHLVSIYDMRRIDGRFKVYEAEYREAKTC